ncbi:MAG: hypothetical protein GW876_12545 [Bacteroidetes bacterium]|nr:hypothetical protein [Bacteroidota bacterium]
MSKILNKILFLILGITMHINLFSQSTVSIEVMAIGLHPFAKPNLQVYENALDIDGLFCVEPGLILSYEAFVWENTVSFQFSQSIYADAAGQMAGFTEISFRRLFFHKWRSSLYIAIGPTMTYRKSWVFLDGYVEEGGYTKYGTWQVKPWFIGKLEYDFYVGNHSDIQLGFIYGHKYNTFTASLGYRYWISSKVKHSKGCNCHNKYKKKFKDWFR